MGGRRDDDPFGPALTCRLAVADLDALPLMGASSEALIVFDPCRMVAPFCSRNVCFPLSVFTTNSVASGVDLIERPDQRSLGRLLASPRLANLQSPRGRHASRTHHVCRHQYRGCDCQQKDRQPHSCSGFGPAIFSEGWSHASAQPQSARQRRSWRSRPGSPANRHDPAGTNPEHNPGASMPEPSLK